MKLYYDPISTTSRPVVMFLHEAKIKADLVPVSLFQDEHKTAEYAAINPNQAVPVLQDGAFTLTESSAILKHLADMAGDPSYPTDPLARARVNQAMDWFNTGFYRDFGYGLVYSRILPEYGFANPMTQADLLRRAQERSERWLAVLDAGLADQSFLCGDAPTIADLMGASYVSIGDWIGFDLSPWPNVGRWMSAMRERPCWTETHEAWNGLVNMLRDQQRQSA
ncbi:MAG TPA: glutathione S-transferase family protein [Phenylobacterium sp.]|nr:glutathione S-transferase family protein [Phenylobacterium sp.]